jgi:dolichyl-phosphate beta-glucosyltransferase
MYIDNLSVVIPAFNEATRVQKTVIRIRNYLKQCCKHFEIIVIDDGSSDGTASVLKETVGGLQEIRILHNAKNVGKGYSIKKGVLLSEGNVILICDADLSAPIEEADKLISWLDKGYDIAIGSRGLKDSDIAIRQPWYRERMGRFFNVLVRLLFFAGIKDTQCGFKAFRADVARQIFRQSRITGFSFDVEILFISRLKGFGIKEVPIRWAHSPDSKIRLFRDSVKMFFDLLKIRFYHVCGAYK